MKGHAREKTVAYLALGSNLGERELFLQRARVAISSLRGTTLVAATPVEETAAVGPVPQGPFLNQMIAIETDLEPMELLGALRKIEDDAGRLREERWGPRTLDLDIVRYGALEVHEADLIIPHPEIPNRPFWLREIEQLEYMCL